MVVCLDFKSGTCVQGANCMFDHVTSSPAVSSQPVSKSPVDAVQSPGSQAAAGNSSNHHPTIESVTPVARAWLDKCFSEHESCKKRAQLCTVWSSDNMHIVHDLGHKDMMPRRLLNFAAETPNLSEPDCIQLIDLQGSEQEIPYLALSHRWGSNETCRATTSNLSSLQENGIILADLPRTFRHAVVLTRALGYHHLWIDSLCIVQDDKQDWKEEAPRMGVVYGNAACTISAMDAVDSEGGLFLSEMKDIERGGLDKRAWVCQERMIAPRSLLFTNNSVSWECREHDSNRARSSLPVELTAVGHLKSSVYPKHIFSVFRDYRIPGVNFDENLHRFIDLSQELRGSPDDYTPFMLAWWQFVSIYSPCNITYESDRFLAMNGVAALTQRWTQLRNSWGLWRHFLEKDLIWYIDLSSSTSRRPNAWLAPSWSWASTLEGKVVNDYYAALPVKPALLIKPQIGIPVGTSFDQALPIPAWRGKEFHSITLHGDLRSGQVITTLDDWGNKHYKMIIEPTGRFSEAEEHDFRPDVSSEFKVDETVKVKCLLFYHYDAKVWKLSRYRDIRLVLVHANGDQEIKPVLDYIPSAEIADERTMRRVGYLETTYDTERDWADIHEDLWWRYVILI